MIRLCKVLLKNLNASLNFYSKSFTNNFIGLVDWTHIEIIEFIFWVMLMCVKKKFSHKKNFKNFFFAVVIFLSHFLNF